MLTSRMKKMNPQDPLLIQLDKWVQVIGRKVTKTPVYLRITSHPFKDKRKIAQMVQYPDEYEIVIQRRDIERFRKTPGELKKIIAHEVAHICYWPRHTQKYRDLAQSLGAGDRAVG